MTKGKLILMMGIPGSGKSTWLKTHKSDTDIIVSRDEIRFELLKDEEEYFSHEDEVWETFIHTIIFHLQHGRTVYADATHLNQASRAKVLQEVAMYAEEIQCIWLNTLLETALSRNALREGRALVPTKVIRNMYRNMQDPQLSEGFDKIIIIIE